MSGFKVEHRLTRAEAIRLGSEIFAAISRLESDETHCVMITAYGSNAPAAFAWKAELDQRGGM